MNLYVGNIPSLANEDALFQWFTGGRVRVKTMELIGESDSVRNVRVEIENEEFPSRVLRHLNGCVFWGHRLVVQKINRETGGWVRQEAAGCARQPAECLMRLRVSRAERRFLWSGP